ncbi:hypothetical protein PIB30_081815 [Stylosanthes scabra]|uniref:Uncharacterized protein n=1 Tax=Stylosanthes scabra TaxID=79078 RepID=A0ABU6RS26_9FABA|nr:hypothetical protein [Stylosanthes scabra]
MRMIPTPGSRVQSSETLGTRAQGQTPTQTTTEDDEPPLPEPDPMPWPPINNPLPEGQEENIALEEELTRQAGRVYLHWDGGYWYARTRPRSPGSFRITRSGGFEFKIFESWRMRAAKRLRELIDEVRNKGAPHGWIQDDLFTRLVEFWRQEDYMKLK